MFIHLNPQYAIRSEPECSFLVRRNGIIDYRIDRVIQSVYLLPPVFGFMFDKIGEQEFEVSVENLSDELGVDIGSLSQFLMKLTENDKPLELKSNEQSILFPPRLLIKSEKSRRSSQTNLYKSCTFAEKRPSIPFSVNFMVTTNCVTNCCYCYANRNISQKLTSDVMLSVIDECNRIGVVNLNLTGGDIFTLKDWKCLLQRARKYNYYPFLSTKKPLSSDDIRFLKSIGLTDIQFSLDSVNPDILSRTVAVESSYVARVTDMLDACKTYNFKLAIRSVLCCYNSTLQSISDLYDFLIKYKEVIRDWVVTPAFFSEHQKEYLKYSAQVTDISAIGLLISKLSKPFPIFLSKMNSCGYTLQKCKTEAEFVCKNQRCYANTYSMSILASGTCTICEMLYEKPEYKLGTILTDSIKEIWNSKKALSLFSFNQGSLPKDTPCASCIVFDKCRNQLSKRVCYVDIAKINEGNNTRAKPDPRCPKSKKVDVIL